MPAFDSFVVQCRDPSHDTRCTAVEAPTWVKDKLTVTVDVTNTSTRDGAGVIQLYVKDVIASVVVPNIQLRGSARC